MPVRNLRWPDDYDAVMDHLHQLYGPQEFQILEQSYGTLPGFDPADCLVIEGDQGEIAAHGLLVTRGLQLGQSLLPAAEVNLFSVLPAYRGRGYEEELLAALHHRMTARGDVLGLSFGLPHIFAPWQYDYAFGLYLTSYESTIRTEQALQAGFWNPDHSYQRRTAERLGTHNRAVEVRRFYLNDLPAVQLLYQTAAGRGHYLMARDHSQWEWQLDHLARIGRNEPDDFLVAEVDGQLVAYVRMVSQEPVNSFRGEDAAPFSVIEAVGEDPDAVEALLGEIARTAQTFNADRIGLFVHPDSKLMQHALARGATLRHFTGAGMLRLHDMPQALELLKPTLADRCQNCRFVDRSYHLYITTEYDRHVVEMGAGGSESELVQLEVPVTALLRLLTGWYGIEHLATGFNARYLDLLSALFPARDPKVGLADMI